VGPFATLAEAQFEAGRQNTGGRALVDHFGKRESELVQRFVESPNPLYRVHEVENVIPFRAEAEMIGATAGRLYLREQNRLVAVTMSRKLMLELGELLERVASSPDGGEA
jgi:hypothetical protein